MSFRNFSDGVDWNGTISDDEDQPLYTMFMYDYPVDAAKAVEEFLTSAAEHHLPRVDGSRIVQIAVSLEGRGKAYKSGKTNENVLKRQGGLERMLESVILKFSDDDRKNFPNNVKSIKLCVNLPSNSSKKENVRTSKFPSLKLNNEFMRNLGINEEQSDE